MTAFVVRLAQSNRIHCSSREAITVKSASTARKHAEFMITGIRLTFQKVIKNNINHTFDGELRHVAIMGYIEASLITSDATFYRATQNISLQNEKYITAKRIASNFSLYAHRETFVKFL